MKRASQPMAALRQLILLAALALGACTGMAPSGPAVDVDRLASQAQTEERRGNQRAAASLYAQAAAGTTGTRRAAFALEAARLEIELRNLDTATQLLTDGRAAGDAAQQQLATVMLARIEVLRARPQQALDLLNGLREPLPVPVTSEAAAVRGQALFALDRYAEAIGVLTDREVWLDDASAILANQRLIWEGLQGYRGAAAPPPTGDPIVDGWLALAPIANRALAPEELRRALLEWRESYRDHPGTRGILGELLAAQRSGAGLPQRVALLLPLSSPQRNFAVAVRDGFVAAHLRNAGAARVDVRVYDTALLGPREAYERAQLEGAEFVVGPLLRPDVEEIIPLAGFVPTLAVNVASTDTALLPSFFQFALFPEHEAEAVARYAVASGARTAIALVASTDVGYRQLNAFRAELERLGGQVLDWSGYDPGVQDFTPQITSLLNITRSNQRYQRLAANLRVPLQFEPRRRQDVDMIFLAADARAGRLLAPQLRFHFAGDIPTYATSQIYEPGDPARDNDLNGVMFTDGPWLIEPGADATGVVRELTSYWPRASGSLLRFYGMGFDAYQLVVALSDPNPRAWPLRGVSGDLVLDTEGRVNRLLPLGQFRAGRPVALDRSPAAAPEPALPNEDFASFR